MGCRERVLTALNSKEPDRVPVFELLIDESSVVKIAKLLMPEVTEFKAEKTRFGEESFKVLDLYCSVVNELEIDATTSNFSVGLEIVDGDHGRDKFGTTYKLSAHGEPCPLEGPIKQPSDVKGFDMTSKLEARDFAGPEHVIDKFGRGRAHFINILDPFKLSWRLTGGMQNLLMYYALNPELVHDLARITTDFDVAAIDMAAKIGADVITLPGDLAGEQNTIISPAHYREYIKPYHKTLVDHAHKKGLKIVKHSDGNIWPILDDFLEVGFDGIHPVQPQCMDIGEVKEYLSGKACVLGNIDCRNLLPFGTVEDVERTVKETIEKAGKGGGYILSSSNSIHPNCKPENYVAMVKATHKYGVYEK
jgi:uroporphyrinogen decarboxylase